MRLILNGFERINVIHKNGAYSALGGCIAPSFVT
jgi:hypothetical protein